MDVRHRRPGVLGVLGVLAGAALSLALPAPAVAAAPGTGIVVVGAATEGHVFHAYRVARYADVDLDGSGRPRGVTLAVTSPALRAELGREVARIETSRTGEAPPVAADGSVQGVDPLDWVAVNWATPSGGWGNPGPAGPLGELADWLGQEVGQTPGHLGLAADTGTGERGEDGTSEVVLDGLEPGLYVLTSDRGGQVGTDEGALLVGTRIPVAGTEWDLYDGRGRVSQELGVVEAKGDAVPLTKTVDGAAATTRAGGDAVPMTITTQLPRYAGFPADVGITFAITDTHTRGLGEPDWEGTDPRVADPVLTVGAATLAYTPGCEVGVTNVDDACFAVTPADAGGTDIGWTATLPDWVVRAHGGATVTLTFGQLLIPEAAAQPGTVAGTQDTNRATVTFSAGTDRPTQTTVTHAAQVTVSTYPLYLTKVDAVSGARLAGAAFTVASGSGIDCFAPDGAGVYWHRVVVAHGARPCPDGTTASVRTAPDGTLALGGLAGSVEYTVAETAAPAGYDASNLKVARFTVTAAPDVASDAAPEPARVAYEYGNAGSAPHLGDFFTTSTAEVTVPTSTGTELRHVATDRVVVANWVNTPAALAHTGADAAVGTIAATLFVAAGVCLFIVRRRRRRTDAR